MLHNMASRVAADDEKTGRSKCSWAGTSIWNVYGHRKFSSAAAEMGLWEVDGVSGTQGYTVWVDVSLF